LTAFAVEGDLDVDAIKSNLFEIEWPSKSGRMQSFPEIDRAAGSLSGRNTIAGRYR
jgi:predicted NUDIX family NTP pyrophosphohydrolase